MTEDELEMCCNALAPHGDSRAQATLKLIAEVRMLRQRPSAPGDKAANAEYVLRRIENAMELAAQLGLLGSRKPRAAIPREVVEQVAAAAGVANLQPLNEAARRSWDECKGASGLKTDAETLSGTLPAPAPIPDGAEPDKVAAAATRAVHDLKPESDPAVVGPNQNPAAGHHDRSEKMNGAAGNKEPA